VARWVRWLFDKVEFAVAGSDAVGAKIIAHLCNSNTITSALEEAPPIAGASRGANEFAAELCFGVTGDGDVIWHLAVEAGLGGEAGRPAQCLMWLKRSSSTAKVSWPFLNTAADESPERR